MYNFLLVRKNSKLFKKIMVKLPRTPLQSNQTFEATRNDRTTFIDYKFLLQQVLYRGRKSKFAKEEKEVKLMKVKNFHIS